MAHRRTLIGISAIVLLGAGTAAPAKSAVTADDTFAVNRQLTGAQLRTLLEQTATMNATGQRLLHAKQAVEAAGKQGGR